MPKSLRIIVIVLIIILVAGFAYLFFTRKDNPETAMNTGTSESTEVTTTTDQQTVANTQQSTTTEPGKYVNYSATSLANTDGTRILFFHAPWCPQCRQLQASINAGPIPSGVTIFKVDYDSNQKLRQEYGVTIQTTVVLLNADGSEAKKFVAYDEPSLQAVINNLL